MRGKTLARDLAPLGLEIEATCRRNNAAKKRRELQDRTANLNSERIFSSESSSSFPTKLREIDVHASKANIMAEDQQQRVTLEDYSSSTMP